ncbi:hypothetical protein GWI33_019653, partial [Rhynchophorus ferrugineus]
LPPPAVVVVVAATPPRPAPSSVRVPRLATPRAAYGRSPPPRLVDASPVLIDSPFLCRSPTHDRAQTPEYLAAVVRASATSVAAIKSARPSV